MTVSSVSVVSFGERCAPSTPAPRSAHRRAHRRARAVRPDASRAFAPGRMLAASGSFFITTLVTHPLDVVKTNLQLERSAKGKVPATGVKQAHKSRAPSPRQTQHSSCAAAARHQSALLRRWSAVRALPQYRMLTSALPPPRSPSVPLTSALPTPPPPPAVEPPPHTPIDGLQAAAEGWRRRFLQGDRPLSPHGARRDGAGVCAPSVLKSG